MTKPVAIDQEVPKPLEPLTVLRVDDQNKVIEQMTLEERMRRLEPILSGRALVKYRRIRKRLHRLLNKIGWNDLCQERNDLRGRYLDAKERYVRARDALRQSITEGLPGDERQVLIDRYKRAKAQARAITVRGKEVQADISKFQPDYDSYAEAVRLLEAHQQAVRFQEEERQNRKQFYAEASWYETIMLGVFRNSARCHFIGRDRRGREYRIIPRFQRIKVDSDTLWYLLETSQRTPFGWKFLLPYDVDVTDLVSDETLENLKAATGRQVDVVRGKKSPAIWYVVHRLDSPDGLPQHVPYKKLLAHYPGDKHPLLPFPVGVKAGRIAEWQCFGEQPHVLIAGSSQSGKSNEINCIISTVITMNSPQECRLLLIDLKGGIELSHFNGIPHLIGEMVKRVDDLLPALEHITRIMNKRFDRLAAAKSKEILDYNAVVPEERRMPRILLVFDEMATFLALGDTTRKIHNHLREITGKGRAVGIHCVLCNQYTNVDAIPGFIKTNLAIRISGAMPSGSASMTVLDSHSAKELPRIPGRMIMQIGSVETTVQAAYISVAEIAEAVEQAKTFGEAPELDAFPELEPTPEPEPIELTGRERAVLEVLAAVPAHETISVRRIADRALLPVSSAHYVLSKLADKGCVGKISGSFAIVEQGRLALERLTLVQEEVQPETDGVRIVRSVDNPPDEEPEAITSFSTNGYHDPDDPDYLEALEAESMMEDVYA